jgi:hypothetical protein
MRPTLPSGNLEIFLPSQNSRSNQFSVGEGLKRAVKNRLRTGNKGSEADLDWKAQELAGSMRRYVNDHAIEAEMYLSRRSEMDSIHKRQVTARRRRDSSLRLYVVGN